MCIDVVEIWLLKGRFHQFLTVIWPPLDSSGLLWFHVFIEPFKILRRQNISDVSIYLKLLMLWTTGQIASLKQITLMNICPIAPGKQLLGSHQNQLVKIILIYESKVTSVICRGPVDLSLFVVSLLLQCMYSKLPPLRPLFGLPKSDLTNEDVLILNIE